VRPFDHRATVVASTPICWATSFHCSPCRQCLVLAMVVTARNYRRLPVPDSRRRIRLVVAGLLTAVIPYAAAVFAYRIAGVISDAAYHSYAAAIAWLPMICIPASLAAAVWKEQLFDIRVLVRHGLQYLFARTALRVLFALPIALLLFSIFRNPPDRLQIPAICSLWEQAVDLLRLSQRLEPYGPALLARRHAHRPSARRPRLVSDVCMA